MTGPPPRDRLATAVLVCLVALLPFAPAAIFLTPDLARVDLLQRTALHVFDGALLAVMGLAVRHWAVGGWQLPRTVGGRLALAFGAVAVLALAFHPSAHGVEILIRYAGVLAIATEIRHLGGRDRQVVLAATFAFGVFEAVLSLAQVANDGPLWHGPLEMTRFPLFQFGGLAAGQGSFSHPYHLASALAVATAAGLVGLRGVSTASRRWWVAGFPVLGLALGMSYSRMVLVAVAVVVVIVVAFRRGQGRAVAVLAVALLAGGFLLGGAIGLDGWRYKEAITTNAGEFDSSRGELATIARHLIAEHPLVGIGPGRYVEVVAEEQPASKHLPPHDIVLQAAAEEGILAGVLIVLLGIVVARQALRGRVEGTAALVLLLPFLLFDAYPYVYPHGLALSGLWLGIIFIAAGDAPGDDRRPADQSAGRNTSWHGGGSAMATERSGASF